jgi:hypothetical protein
MHAIHCIQYTKQALVAALQAQSAPLSSKQSKGTDNSSNSNGATTDSSSSKSAAVTAKAVSKSGAKTAKGSKAKASKR